MNKKELKIKAQEDLLSAMQTAFCDMPREDPDNLDKVMSDQMARVEKLFGFEPYSFLRGG